MTEAYPTGAKRRSQRGRLYGAQLLRRRCAVGTRSPHLLLDRRRVSYTLMDGAEPGPECSRVTYNKSIALLQSADSDAARRDIELLVEWYRTTVQRKALSAAQARGQYRKALTAIEALRTWPYSPPDLDSMIEQLREGLDEAESLVVKHRPPGASKTAYLIWQLRDLYEKHSGLVAGRSSKSTVKPRSPFVLFAEAVNAEAGLGIKNLASKISEALTGQQSDEAQARRKSIRGTGLMQKWDRSNRGD